MYVISFAYAGTQAEPYNSPTKLWVVVYDSLLLRFFLHIFIGMIKVFKFDYYCLGYEFFWDPILSTYEPNSEFHTIAMTENPRFYSINTPQIQLYYRDGLFEFNKKEITREQLLKKTLQYRMPIDIDTFDVNIYEIKDDLMKRFYCRDISVSKSQNGYHIRIYSDVPTQFDELLDYVVNKGWCDKRYYKFYKCYNSIPLLFNERVASKKGYGCEREYVHKHYLNEVWEKDWQVFVTNSYQDYSKVVKLLFDLNFRYFDIEDDFGVYYGVSYDKIVVEHSGCFATANDQLKTLLSNLLL